MTTLKDYRDTYYSASTKASDVARQLGFVGIALVWIFKSNDGSSANTFYLPTALFWPSFFIIVSLCLDLTHYIVKAAIWGYVQRRIEKEHGGDASKSYDVKDWINLPALILFWAKLAIMVMAYVLLLQFAYSRVIFGTGSSGNQTLYANTVYDAKARNYIASFDEAGSVSENKAACEQAQLSFQQRAGKRVRYWCEPGRYRQRGP